MKITKKTKTPLLSRIDVVAEINHPEKRTPSREEIKEELSKELKADKKLILVDHIYTNYGDNKSEIIAYIYDSKETMEKIGKVKVEEAPKVEEKTEVKEEAKVEEKPTEEAPKKEKVEENGKKTSEE
jgi:ribosomal protein S24E